MKIIRILIYEGNPETLMNTLNEHTFVTKEFRSLSTEDRIKSICLKPNSYSADFMENFLSSLGIIEDTLEIGGNKDVSNS